MLYDYETTTALKKTFKIGSTCSLRREQNEIEVVNDTINEVLISIIIEQNDCTLVSTPMYPIWKVIRSPRNSTKIKNYILKQGTVIKLGRLQFQVKALKMEDDCLEEVEAEIAVMKESICKFCLCENSREEDPLISICKCDGSMKYIHIECLQKWLVSRITTNGTENSVMKCLKSIHCELCKKKLPFRIKVAEESYDLLKGQHPQVPYLILEGIHTEHREPGVYLISFTDKKWVMLGRGHDSDVRIPDISVSRCHAKISFCDNEFVIEDNFSKFGTLVMMNESLVLKKRAVVQCGRTILEFNRNPFVKGNDTFDWERS